MSRQDRLVLHFDVNKTLTMSDPAAGKGVEEVVRSIVSDVAMGVVTHDASGAPRWTLGSSSSGADGSTGMSFHAYVERVLHPYARLPATAGGGERAAVAAANARAKDARRGALGAFYDEGAPGETLLPQVDAMLSKLRLPGTGEYTFVIPAYFELLRSLHAAGRDFRIVFRTFGTDSAAVVAEHNAFCEGRHPGYPGVVMDGSDGGTDRRAHLPCASARMLRVGAGAAETVLAYVDPDSSLVTTSVGYDCISKWLSACFEREQHTLAVQDCYAFWFACGEVTEAGKLFTVAPPGSGARSIFFDDNIQESDAYIVDARWPDGRALPFRACENRCLVRADPLAAVMHVDYFIRKVAECEAAYAGIGDLGC